MERHLIKFASQGIDSKGAKWACGFGRCTRLADFLYVFYSIGKERGEVLTHHSGACTRCKENRLDKMNVPVVEGDA